MTNQLVAVIGVGVMGTGIARMCLEAGYEVALSDRSPAALDGGIRKLAKLDPAFAQRIVGADVAEALCSATVVVDATPQRIDEKALLLREIAELTPDQTVIGTVTLATPLRVLDPDGRLLERLVGMHFMNPPHRLRLCELVVRDGVAPASVAHAARFLARLPVDVIRVADTPAFVLNKVLVPFLMDAVRVVERGETSAAEIDLAFTKGCGHPMGPLAVLDLLGLDVALRTVRELHLAYPEDPRFDPPALLARMAAQGARFHPVSSMSPMSPVSPAPSTL